MKFDHFPSAVTGSETNESPAGFPARSEMVPDPEPPGWSETRKRFLEDVRQRGGAATIPGCPPDITIEKVEQAWPAFWKCMREALRVARQKDCPPGVDLEDGLMAMRELEKMVRESFVGLSARSAPPRRRLTTRSARRRGRPATKNAPGARAARPRGAEGRRPDARGRVSPLFQRGGRGDGVEAYRSRPRQLQGLGA
jgi:hypothetical protein